MNAKSESNLYSRRQFVGEMVGGTLVAGAAALSGPQSLAAKGNPYAYDVSRFSKTDPKLVWCQ